MARDVLDYLRSNDASVSRHDSTPTRTSFQKPSHHNQDPSGLNLSLDGSDGLLLLLGSDTLGLGDLDVRGGKDDLDVGGVSLVRVDSTVSSESSSVGFLNEAKNRR